MAKKRSLIYVGETKTRGRYHLATDNIFLWDLIRFAEKLGIKPSHIHKIRSHPHFDITEKQRVLAIELGAIPCPDKELFKKCFGNKIENHVRTHMHLGIAGFFYSDYFTDDLSTPKPGDREGESLFAKTKIQSFGDLMTLNEFIENCKSGLLIDWDGTGYYSDEDGYYMSFAAKPSDVIEGKIKTVFTNVIWFNK